MMMTSRTWFGPSASGWSDMGCGLSWAKYWVVAGPAPHEGRCRCLGSGQGEEELLQGLGVHRVGAVGLGQALLEAGRDDGEAGPVQGAVGRSELGDDVLAVAALLDHAQDAADLALGSAQPVDHGAHLVRVQLNHGGSFEVAVASDAVQLSAGACESDFSASASR